MTRGSATPLNPLRTSTFPAPSGCLLHTNSGSSLARRRAGSNGPLDTVAVCRVTSAPGSGLAMAGCWTAMANPGAGMGSNSAPSPVSFLFYKVWVHKARAIKCLTQLGPRRERGRLSIFRGKPIRTSLGSSATQHRKLEHGRGGILNRKEADQFPSLQGTRSLLVMSIAGSRSNSKNPRSPPSADGLTPLCKPSAKFASPEPFKQATDQTPEILQPQPPSI